MVAYTSGDLQHVGNQSSTDGSSRLVLLVLASIGEIGNDGSDAASRGSAAGVDHDEKLHKPIVHVSGSRRLQDEDVLISN